MCMVVRKQPVVLVFGAGSVQVQYGDLYKAELFQFVYSQPLPVFDLLNVLSGAGEKARLPAATSNSWSRNTAAYCGCRKNLGTES